MKIAALILGIFMCLSLSSQTTESTRYSKNVDLFSLSSSQLRELIEDSIAVFIDPPDPSKPNLSWKDVGILNPDDVGYKPEVRFYFLTPGDYSQLGTLKFIGNSGYQNTDSKIEFKHIIAAQRRGQNNVRILSSNFCREPQNENEVFVRHIQFFTSSYWVVHGITFGRNQGVNANGKAIGATSLFESCSNHNIINHCIFEDIQGGPMVRIINSSFNTIQNSIFRTLNEDILCDLSDRNVGVLISAYAEGDSLYNATQDNRNRRCDTAYASVQNLIVKNKFYDLVDGIQTEYNNAIRIDTISIDTVDNIITIDTIKYRNGPTGYTPGTVVDSNSIYIDKLKVFDILQNGELAYAENAIDIKVNEQPGSDRYMIISNNSFWGIRFSVPKPNDKDECPIPCGFSVPHCNASGGDGALITVHINAQKIKIENNLFYDAPVGIRINGPNSKDTIEPKVDWITITDNTFAEIRKHPGKVSDDVNGYPIIISQTSDSVRVEKNKIINCDNPIRKQNNCSSNQEILIQGNEVYNIKNTFDPCYLHTNGNTTCLQLEGNSCGTDCRFRVRVVPRSRITYGCGELRVTDRCSTNR